MAATVALLHFFALQVTQIEQFLHSCSSFKSTYSENHCRRSQLMLGSVICAVVERVSASLLIWLPKPKISMFIFFFVNEILHVWKLAPSYCDSLYRWESDSFLGTQQRGIPNCETWVWFCVLLCELLGSCMGEFFCGDSWACDEFCGKHSLRSLSHQMRLIVAFWKPDSVPRGIDRCHIYLMSESIAFSLIFQVRWMNLSNFCGPRYVHVLNCLAGPVMYIESYRDGGGRCRIVAMFCCVLSIGMSSVWRVRK